MATRVKAIQKYLSAYAEPETGLLQELPDIPPFHHVLVIPAYREPRVFFDRLAMSLLHQHAVLLIVVINQPDTLTEPDNQNQVLWNAICQQTSEIWHAEHLQLRNLPHTASAILLVDRFSQLPVPHKQGVGLARKIGADLALRLIDLHLVKQDWIYSSDADARLPEDYFSALQPPTLACLAPNVKHAAVAVFPFRHLCKNDTIGLATRLYEQRLQQYVDGLSTAQSPYAYHSLGSTLAIKAASYAMVRGFPKRNAGEDFYLLNKVAKQGAILNLARPLIEIDARQSDRVPFGTGPAIRQLLLNRTLDDAIIFYHPDVFRHLGQWLQVMSNTWQQALTDQALSKPVIEALRNLGIDKAIKSNRTISKTQDTYTKHMHIWFDGFRTLRFIHLLRETGLHNLTWAELMSVKTHNDEIKREHYLSAKLYGVNGDSRDNH